VVELRTREVVNLLHEAWRTIDIASSYPSRCGEDRGVIQAHASGRRRRCNGSAGLCARPRGPCIATRGSGRCAASPARAPVRAIPSTTAQDRQRFSESIVNLVVSMVYGTIVDKHPRMRQMHRRMTGA
jgi:hypothetical protein